MRQVDAEQKLDVDVEDANRTYDLRIPGYSEESVTDVAKRRKRQPNIHGTRVAHVREVIRKASIVKRSERIRNRRR
eukprot:jgi/Hompol1/3938/HPOL_001531-RA